MHLLRLHSVDTLTIAPVISCTSPGTAQIADLSFPVASGDSFTLVRRLGPGRAATLVLDRHGKQRRVTRTNQDEFALALTCSVTVAWETAELDCRLVLDDLVPWTPGRRLTPPERGELPSPC